jgi:hypothetical protein
MKRLILLLLAALAIMAQEKETVALVTLKHVIPDSVRPALQIVANGRARFTIDNATRIVAITGPEIMVEALEKLVKSLDVPRVEPPAPKNIELTFHILTAGGTAGAGAVPPDLNGVVQQLGNVFALKSFRLLETAVVRGRDGGRAIDGSGVLGIPVKVDASPGYNLRMQRLTVSAEAKGGVIRIDGLDFTVNVPFSKIGGQGLDWQVTGIKTDLDVREGQKVVVGKSSFDTTGQALFLVVSAKILD